jgi:hypothetical protein
MPYLKNSDRIELEDRRPQTSGELNYTITNLLIDYIDSKGTSYDVINSIIGVLECAKLEFYRRLAAPYEDTKIAENGDVY